MNQTQSRKTQTALFAGRGLCALLLLALAFAGNVSPAHAAAKVIFAQYQMPVDGLQVYVPCAAGGSGESVVLSGSMNVLFYEVHSESGAALYRSKVNNQGIKGTGAITGDVYQGTGVSMGTSTVNVGQTYTSRTVENYIGPGAGNNFQVNMLFHLTQNATGEMTGYAEVDSVTCK